MVLGMKKMLSTTYYPQINSQMKRISQEIKAFLQHYVNYQQDDWIKKYHKIIQELETMADIQLQVQNIIKLANAINNQLANIETILLQTGETYKMQIRGDIFIAYYVTNIHY